MKKSFEEAGMPARILEFASGSLKGYNVEATLKVSFTYMNHENSPGLRGFSYTIYTAHGRRSWIWTRAYAASH